MVASDESPRLDTWLAYGGDGNGDYRDPHNIVDAALAAAAYLCASGSPMATEAHWRQGIYAYNRSRAYVDDVLAGSYRNPSQQIALRRAHCGTSPYAIFEMPASQCSPPPPNPARPATSVSRGSARAC
jgi:membrane-bound lytic murein transglycosylase B